MRNSPYDARQSSKAGRARLTWRHKIALCFLLLCVAYIGWWVWSYLNGPRMPLKALLTAMAEGDFDTQYDAFYRSDPPVRQFIQGKERLKIYHEAPKNCLISKEALMQVLQKFSSYIPAKPRFQIMEVKEETKTFGWYNCELTNPVRAPQKEQLYKGKIAAAFMMYRKGEKWLVDPHVIYGCLISYYGEKVKKDFELELLKKYVDEKAPKFKGTLARYENKQ